MDNAWGRQAEALRLIERIIALQPDQGSLRHALKLRDRLRLPMSLVLEKLWPELNIAEKCRRLGVARSAYYAWMNGLYRPDEKFAKRLAKETGLDAKEIEGKG